MRKLKVMTILGTRPEIIRLSACIRACDRSFDHLLCHTGQNWDYTLNEVFFRDLNLRAPDFYLDCAGEDLGATMGNVIARSYTLLARERPDALLILGDTNSALCAISAKRLKIPIFHMEAGNRCFDQNVPEETNRRIVDHISDINMPYTEHGRRYLLREGISPEWVFVTGSPMREVLAGSAGAVAASGVLADQGLDAGRYIVLSAHREENVDHPAHLQSLMRGVNAVAEAYGLPVVFSTHPRSRKRLDEAGFALHPLVRSLPPFGFHDYVRLQRDAFCVLSDSGTLSEESAILGFPAVLIRTSTERPEAIDKGACVLGGIEDESMLQAVALARELADAGRPIPPVPDYQDATVSDKVVRMIQSFTAIINQRVWHKG
ncbi:MAG: UDP-N-acetylglucosamine 2-epimerase (non-hydrolyzing) [Oscillospiraceae bacterium]|jgi:UDP-N-acetylglucosamine 2-epimerase (non-hydrolysing)|nr:UDP-N-acetylglucosamine 2-epimerase (non-hydrolyzing) [Oscillospiraceae bacterium]